MVVPTLRRFRALVKELEADLLPQSDDPATQGIYRASLLGVLQAALNATVIDSTIGGRAAVMCAAQNTREEHPEVQVELDQFRALGPKGLARSQDYIQDCVNEGIQAAHQALVDLPESEEDDEHRDRSQRVGAMIGYLYGMVELGGFHPSVYDAMVVAIKAIRQMRHLKQQARMVVELPPVDPSKAN